jgi:mannitol/fructose-specific phosphotransferase system IIA component (Ntr-type)
MQSLLSKNGLMPEVIQVGFIDPAMKALDKEALISQLVSLADVTGRVLDRKALWEGLLAREAEDSTAANGCALLHLRVPKAEIVSSSFMVLGRTPQAIEFGAADKLDVDIFFSLCCQSYNTYRLLLDRVSGMILRAGLLAQLRQAADAPAMYACIIACEQDLLANAQPRQL